MKLGRLPRGMGAAALSVLAPVLLAPSAASAAPAAPPAYVVFASARPMFWSGSSSLPVADLRVPFVQGETNNLAAAKGSASLALPDRTVKPMSGESIQGLTCTGFEAEKCKDPFWPEALASHPISPDGGREDRSAFFVGKDGKFPGSIRAVTDCSGRCGEQLVHSLAEAAGPAGALPGYISIAGSSAGQDLSIDDKGRLVGTARSELRNVVIGPRSEVRIGTLLATAQAIGAGAENSKEGRADLRASDFVILDNPVELTRAGIRLANGAPSDKEAYDGGRVLLQQLKDRGIILELPDFNAQVTRKPDHVTVDTGGLTVRFDQSVQGPVPASTQTQPLELGHSTAVVAAFDSERQVDVKMNPQGQVVVDSQPVGTTPLAPGPDGTSDSSATTAEPGSSRGRADPSHPVQDPRVVPPPSSGSPSPVPGTGGTVAPGNDATLPPSEVTSPTQTLGPPPPATDPGEAAFKADQLARSLGLRDARSVSRAFGAFLGLGLILPLARFVIRRLG
jgi:hypothetical protein